jgi:hypothetical protein
MWPLTTGAIRSQQSPRGHIKPVKSLETAGSAHEVEGTAVGSIGDVVGEFVGSFVGFVGGVVGKFVGLDIIGPCASWEREGPFRNEVWHPTQIPHEFEETWSPGMKTGFVFWLTVFPPRTSKSIHE